MKQTSLSIWILVMLFSAFLGGAGFYFGQQTAEWVERKIKKDGDTNK